MDLSDAVERLSYDPRFSWVSNDPLAYFNKHSLAVGEPFKVLVRYPQAWHGPPYVSISSANGERVLTKELIPLRPLQSGRSYYPYYHGTIVNTTDELRTGSYTAQVLLAGRDREFSFLGAKHSFEVHEPDFYTQRLQQMMGETWDEPVYLDKLEPEETENLLLSLPTDEFLSFLPESSVVDNTAICHLLGPLVTTFMQSVMGPLPFLVDYRVVVDQKRLPHIDLIKFIWLLNAVAPAWADMMFFSGACIVLTRVDDQSMYLGIARNLPDVFDTHYETQEQVRFSPLLTTVMDNIRNELNCDIHWTPPHIAWIEVRE